MLVISLAARVLEAGAMVVGQEASHLRQVLALVQGVAVAAIAVEQLVVEMARLDRPIASQISVALVAAGSGPHLRVQGLEGLLPLVFLLLRTVVELEV